MRSKRLLILIGICLTVVLIGSLSIAGCAKPAPTPAPTPTPAAEAEWTLTYDAFHPPGLYVSKAGMYFMELVEERSGGRVKFDSYFGGALSSSTELLGTVRSGGSDVSQIVVNYFPGEMPLAQCTSLGFISLHQWAWAKAITEFYSTYEPAVQEFANYNIKILYTCPGGHNTLWSSKPVPNADALKGMKVRAFKYSAKAMEWLGATPVSIDWSDSYVALQQGTIDGWWDNPFAIGWTAKCYEVGPYVVETGCGCYGSQTTVIREDLFNELPSDIQKIVLDSAAEAGDRAYQIQSETGIAAVDDMVANDLAEPNIWSDAEIAKAQAMVQPGLTEYWVEQTEADYPELDAKAAVEKFYELVHKYEKVQPHKTPFEYWEEKLAEK